MSFDPDKLKVEDGLSKGTCEFSYNGIFGTITVSEMDGNLQRMLTITNNHLPQKELEDLLCYFEFDPNRPTFKLELSDTSDMYYQPIPLPK